MRINVNQKNGNHCYYKKAYTKEMSRKLTTVHVNYVNCQYENMRIKVDDKTNG